MKQRQDATPKSPAVACALQERFCDVEEGMGDVASELPEIEMDDLKILPHLPRELLLLLFARLPMDEIHCLQLLNDWRVLLAELLMYTEESHLQAYSSMF